MADNELRLGDIPGLTPEQKAGLEMGINALERRILDSINPTLMTPDGIKGIVQEMLRLQLDALRPSAMQADKALELELKGAWARSLVGSPEQRAAAIAKLNSDKFRPLIKATIASVTSGTATYTNTTPALVVNDILKYASVLFWHREESKVVPTTMRSGTYPVGGATRVTAYRRTQGDDHTASSPTMGGLDFTKLPLSDSVIVSNELLEWGISVVYQFLVEEVGYAIGLKEFTEFQTGTNSSQWNGHENAGYTEATSGADNMLVARNLYWALPEMFRPGAMFWANGTTIAAIQNATNPAGFPYWPGSEPLTMLCGKKLRECSVATNGLLFFGDLKRYIIFSGDMVTGATSEGQHLASANSTMVYAHTDNDAGPADTNSFRWATITV